jgi:hypothetical protein
MTLRVVESGNFRTHISRISSMLLTCSPGCNNGGQSEILLDISMRGGLALPHAHFRGSVYLSVRRKTFDNFRLEAPTDIGALAH